LVVALLFAVLVAIFAVQNAQPVSIRFMAWEQETTTAVVVVFAAAVGALAAGCFGFVRQIRMALRLRSAQGQAARLEGEKAAAESDLQAAQAEIARLEALVGAFQTAPPAQEIPERAVSEEGAAGSSRPPRGGAEADVQIDPEASGDAGPIGTEPAVDHPNEGTNEGTKEESAHEAAGRGKARRTESSESLESSGSPDDVDFDGGPAVSGDSAVEADARRREGADGDPSEPDDEPGRAAGNGGSAEGSGERFSG